MVSILDTEPGVYIMGDRDAGGVKPVAYRYAQLGPEVLSAKQSISYKARDGLSIEGFLTLPKSKKNLPTVIFTHGGPISFSSDGKNPGAAFV